MNVFGTYGYGLDANVKAQTYDQKLDFMHKGHIDIYKTNESKLMIHYLYMHTLIPIELLPYLQCVAITETKWFFR